MLSFMIDPFFLVLQCMGLGVYIKKDEVLQLLIEISKLVDFLHHR